MGGEDTAVRAEESLSGGVDVWSDAVSSHAPDHLLVMVHGILGSTGDRQYAANEFVKLLPDDVIVHCSERNMSMLTLDGVDVMGERLADEVLDVINRKPELTKISFLAHSVGGLAARYAIAKLYRCPDGASDGKAKGTICGLEAMNFITVATPHLGSRGNKQVPLLFGSVAMEKVASHIVHWIFRRTGRHLFLTDDDERQPPLLQRMVEDHGDLYFISALRAFNDEWHMQMLTVIILLAGEHHLLEETLSCLSWWYPFLRSTPTSYMRSTRKKLMMRSAKIQRQIVIWTFLKRKW